MAESENKIRQEAEPEKPAWMKDAMEKRKKVQNILEAKAKVEQKDKLKDQNDNEDEPPPAPWKRELKLRKTRGLVPLAHTQQFPASTNIIQQQNNNKVLSRKSSTSSDKDHKELANMESKTTVMAKESTSSQSSTVTAKRTSVEPGTKNVVVDTVTIHQVANDTKENQPPVEVKKEKEELGVKETLVIETQSVFPNTVRTTTTSQVTESQDASQVVETQVVESKVVETQGGGETTVVETKVIETQVVATDNQELENGSEPLIPAWKMELAARRKNRPLISPASVENRKPMKLAETPKWKLDLADRTKNKRTENGSSDSDKNSEGTSPWKREQVMLKKSPGPPSLDDTDGEKPSSPPAWAVHAAERRAKLAKRGLIKLDDDEIDS